MVAFLNICRHISAAPQPTQMPDLLPYLDSAAAHPEFKREVLDYVRGRDTARIELDGYAPRVKVERLLTQLLHAYPTLPVEAVVVKGHAGCSDFTGELTVKTSEAELRFAFTWC